MELEELKSTWLELSNDLEKQKRLTHDLIIKMAGEKSSSRLNRIIIAETIGAAMTLFGMFYLAVNFYKLDNGIALVGGIGITLVLLVSLVLGIKIITAARKIDLVNDPYKEVVKNYAQLRKVLYQNKWISSRLMVVIPALLIPALYTITTGENIIDNTDKLIKAIIGCVVLIPLIWFLILRFYKGTMSKVNEALKDIEELENN